jgi:hypothetical protein
MISEQNGVSQASRSLCIWPGSTSVNVQHDQGQRAHISKHGTRSKMANRRCAVEEVYDYRIRERSEKILVIGHKNVV